MSVTEHRYLIIGGVPKAGTTSLYTYLADHPDVCASSLKETRFFLDGDYPVISAQRFNGQNIQNYERFFRHCRERCDALRVEASPDYLYSKTALQIASLLPYAKIVFIQRDPVERMVSGYKYAKQRGLITKGISFESYVMAQVEQSITMDKPPHLRILDQGRYEKYLPAFRHAFGDRCMILDFNDLKSDPGGVMARICTFARLDKNFYTTYQFRVKNASYAVRSSLISRVYRATRRRLEYALHDQPAVRKALKVPNRTIKTLLTLNMREAENIVVPDELANLIRHCCELGS